MADLTANQAQQLAYWLRDPDALQAFRIFADSQRQYRVSDLVNEMKKSPPDVMKAAQHAGRIDVYETLLGTLEHFVQTQSLVNVNENS